MHPAAGLPCPAVWHGHTCPADWHGHTSSASGWGPVAGTPRTPAFRARRARLSAISKGVGVHYNAWSADFLGYRSQVLAGRRKCRTDVSCSLEMAPAMLALLAWPSQASWNVTRNAKQNPSYLAVGGLAPPQAKTPVPLPACPRVRRRPGAWTSLPVLQACNINLASAPSARLFLKGFRWI